MRENKTKVIALVALIIAVVGLGIGFAAFSSQLTISSGATVTPNKSDWNVAFDKTFGMNGYSCMAMFVSKPTVEGTTISGMELLIKGNAVMCSFQVKNTGKYRAYLTKAEFVEETLGCEALEEDDENFPEGYTRADDALVTEACKGIDANISVQNVSISAKGDSSIASSNIWTINDIPSDSDVLDYSLGTETDGNNTAIVTFSINYDSNAARADGPFVVKIPDIKLTYSTTPTV